MKCSDLAQEAIDKVRQQRTAGGGKRPAHFVQKNNSGRKKIDFIKIILAAAGVFVFSSFIFVSCAAVFSSFEKQKQYDQKIYKFVDKKGIVHLSNMK